MQQPPRIAVAPNARHSEQHMSLASNFVGTATAGNLTTRQHSSPNFPFLSVTGSSVNPLSGAGSAPQGPIGSYQPPTSPVVTIPATPILPSHAPSQQLPVTFAHPQHLQPNVGATVARSASSLASERRAHTQSPLGSSTSSHVHFGQAQVITPNAPNPPAPNVYNPAAPTVAYVQPPSASVQDALVTNLKKQVACLELECKFLKEKLASNASDNGRMVHRSHDGTAAGSVTQSDTLIKRANELEKEVLSLRNRYAEREQQHQVEIAMARKETEAAVFNAIANNSNKKNDGQFGTARYDAKDVETMKELHAREVVVLQKRIEQLDFELQYKYEGGGDASVHGRGHSRDAMAAEIVHFKDLLRKMEVDNETLKLQNEALLTEGKAAQAKVSALEGASSVLQREKENLLEQVKSISEGKVAELEKQIKDAHSAEVNKHYEMQQAKAEAEKLRHDLKEAIEARLAAEAVVRTANTAKSAAESELFAAKGVARDATSQRDKLATDLNNLTVTHTQLEVKVRQLENKGEADRHSLKVVEQQYCAVLDELEAVKRQARAKDEIYKGIDGTDNQFRTQLLLLRKEKDLAHEQLTSLQRDYSELQQRYAAVEHYAKQQAAEEKLRGALAMMGRTKEDWQSLLQTQMQISNNISSALGDLPDLRMVAESVQFVAPPAQHHQLQQLHPMHQIHHDPTPQVRFETTEANTSHQTLYPPTASNTAAGGASSHPSGISAASATHAAFDDFTRRANGILANAKATSRVVPIEEDVDAPADIYPPIRSTQAQQQQQAQKQQEETASPSSTVQTLNETLQQLAAASGTPSRPSTATPQQVYEQQPATPCTVDTLSSPTGGSTSDPTKNIGPTSLPVGGGATTTETLPVKSEAAPTPSNNAESFRELAALTDRVTEQEARLAELLANKGNTSSA